MRFAKRFWKLTAVLAALMLCQHGHAAFLLVSDPDSLTDGALNGQGGWVANTNPSVVDAVTGPGDGNNILVGDSGKAQTLDAISIADGTTGTLFFQYRYAGNSGLNFGLTDNTTNSVPSTNDDYVVRLNPSSSGGTTFRLYDGNSLLTTDQNTAVNTWYDFWIVMDNSADTYEMYIQGGAFTTQTQITTGGGSNSVFDFFAAPGGTGEITGFSFFTNGTAGARFDNLYVDNSGVNLGNPIPEPAAWAGFLAGMIFIVWRRKLASPLA